MTDERSPTESNYTPGPWEAKVFDECQTVIYGPEYDGGKHEMVAVVSVGPYRPHGVGNVPLITAAPDMLAALKLAQAVEDHVLECEFCLHAPDCQIRNQMAADAGVARAAALAAAEPTTAGEQGQ